MRGFGGEGRERGRGGVRLEGGGGLKMREKMGRRGLGKIGCIPGRRGLGGEMQEGGGGGTRWALQRGRLRLGGEWGMSIAWEGIARRLLQEIAVYLTWPSYTVMDGIIAIRRGIDDSPGLGPQL